MTKDRFLEEVVTKRKNTVNKILYALSWIIIIGGALIAMMALSSLRYGITWSAVVMMLACGGMAVYTFFFHDQLLTEYEYTFTNGALDFAEVYNNKKRKSLGSLNVKNIEAFGKVNSDTFRRYVSMPGLKRMNWFLNRDAELYYFYFTKESEKKMIILEPSEEMVGYIREFLPYGAYRE